MENTDGRPILKAALVRKNKVARTTENHLSYDYVDEGSSSKHYDLYLDRKRTDVILH